VQITGLKPGSQAKFMIEAFSGTSIADSAWVSLTTPAHASSHGGPLLAFWPMLWRMH
jgi:hypothetical protein